MAKFESKEESKVYFKIKKSTTKINMINKTEKKKEKKNVAVMHQYLHEVNKVATSAICSRPNQRHQAERLIIIF